MLGETPGDHVPGIVYPAYKVQIQNSDIDKGKHSGYRMLYYLEHDDLTVLLTLYVKNEQEDISLEKIRQIMAEFSENRGN